MKQSHKYGFVSAGIAAITFMLVTSSLLPDDSPFSVRALRLHLVIWLGGVHRVRYFPERSIQFSAAPSHDIEGKEDHGLRPDFLIQRNGSDWYIVEYMEIVTNSDRYTWLIPVDPFNAVLTLSDLDGTSLAAKKRAIAALSLPRLTTISNALRNLESSDRGYQWAAGVGHVGDEFQIAAFPLSAAFEIPHERNLVLSVSPLMYRQFTNASVLDGGSMVRLVEFPALNLLLKTNGDVEKLE